MKTTTVGAFEAKTHLSSLLERVEQGEEIVITKHGRPVARLSPAQSATRDEVDEAIAGIKARRVRMKLGPVNWRKLRDEGRR